jgi:hypothetical protein
MKTNDSITKFKQKNNKIERLFILMLNKYFNLNIVPCVNDDNKFLKYVYYGEKTPESTDEEEDYVEFNINNLKTEHLEQLDECITEELYNTIIDELYDNIYNKWLMMSEEYSDVIEFIKAEQINIFTKAGMFKLIQAAKYESSEQADLTTIKLIDFADIVKFKKSVIKLNKMK